MNVAPSDHKGPGDRIMVVVAHPDDAEFMCGGTVAAWAAEGTEVHYCVVTDGSAGSNEPGVTREWGAPLVVVSLRDVRGIRSTPVLTWNGESRAFESGAAPGSITGWPITPKPPQTNS